MSDIPLVAILAIVGYLPKTQRALFAAACTASPAAWKRAGWHCQLSDISSAIVSSEPDGWEEIDFNDLADVRPMRLETRLTAGDVASLLGCINARVNLKKLTLWYPCHLDAITYFANAYTC